TMKLRQMTSGAVKYSEIRGKKKFRVFHYKKAEELRQLLLELNGEPAIVYYEFRHEVKAVREYFRKHAPEYADFAAINGSTKQWQKAEYLRKFKSGKIPLLFSNVTRGLNLQGRGGIVIYYSLPWSLEKYQQF